jgi:phosphoglycerol transferase
VSGWGRVGPRAEVLWAGAITLLACLLSLELAFGPLEHWLRYPIAYRDSGDSLWNLYVVKTHLEAGWWGDNTLLGAPFGASFLDFPRPELLYLAAYSLGGLLTSNIIVIHNLFYLAGYPLVAWSALAVLRRGVRLSWPLAIAGAIVYAWLPYHVARIGHLFLSNYMTVPLAAWLLLRLADDRPPFFERGRPGWPEWKVWGVLVLLATTSVYYAFFAAVLFVGLGAVEAVVWRDARRFVSGALLSGVLTLLVAGALLPTFVHRARVGSNRFVAARSVVEADIYALRPLHLVLPSESHRVPAMAALAQRYNANRADVNENRDAALGLVGALGVLFLLAHLLTGNRVLPAGPPADTLARASLLAVLLGVSGGIGAFVALTLTPQFRALNRVSVFVGFFAVAAVLVAVNWVLGRLPRRRRRALLTPVAVALAAFAFWDQLPRTLPDHAAIAADFESDRDFVRRVERRVPPGSMIYQLPYTEFPEALPLRNEPPYSPLRPYLHSRVLRWSFGGMRGREGDGWNRALERLPLDERVRVLRQYGFAGIVIDRQALRRRGDDVAAELEGLGLVRPIASADGSLRYYEMPPALAPLGAPLVPVFGRGFQGVEGTHPGTWSWSGGDADLLVHDGGDAPREVTLTCRLASVVARSVEVRAGDRRVRIAVPAESEAVPLTLRFVSRPGWNTVSFITDRPAERLASGNDRRLLAFSVSHVRVE